MTHPPLPPVAEPSGDRPARLRDRLREETRPEHEALDALFETMFRPDAAALYATFLRMNREAHRAIEPRLAGGALPEDLAPGGERRRAAERDCAALGLPDASAPHERDLAARLLPERPTRFEALGMAYVLEGSRLGARFMLKALARGEAGADARNGLPAHYLEASGDTRPFADLLKAMERASAREGDEAVRAARATFRYFTALATGRSFEETAQA